MRRRLVLMAGAAAAVLLGSGCARAAPVMTTATSRTTPAGSSAASAGAASVWGRSAAVPGLAALNKGDDAAVSAVSCPTPGNCAAVGFYKDGGGHHQGFVASESNGRWHQAVEVPGLAALDKGRSADVNAVSCAAAGNCAAVGGYSTGGGHRQGFVISEVNGRWGRALEVPGLAALNKGSHASVSSVSCGSPGSCAAVGDYTDGQGNQQGFVAVTRNSVWGQAVQVPGLGALNTGGSAYVASVSCASAGYCAAVGGYVAGASGPGQAFAVSEENGRWGTARQIAVNLGTGPGGNTNVDVVSCGSAGNCAAGGQAGNTSGDQAFVVSEVNGTWDAARAIAGTQSTTGGSQITSVSCPSAGNCAAGGQYDYGGYNAAFLVNEKNGAWGKKMYVPGLNAVSRDAYLYSVSCASPGNCAAGGNYDTGVFLAVEKSGGWGKETTVPGSLLVREVTSGAGAAAAHCVAGGFYVARGHGYVAQGFVTSAVARG